MLRKNEIREIAKIRRDQASQKHPLHSQKYIDNFTLSFNKGTIISGYYPFGSEVNILPLLKELEESGAALCLPKVQNDGKMVFQKYRVGDELIKSRIGLFEPLNVQAILVPEIMLVPVLAYDLGGNRLGYGKGYYDKYIFEAKKLYNPILVGIAFNEQEFEFLPYEAHDQRLDYLVNQNEFISFKNSTKNS